MYYSTNVDCFILKCTRVMTVAPVDAKVSSSPVVLTVIPLNMLSECICCQMIQRELYFHSRYTEMSNL